MIDPQDAAAAVLDAATTGQQIAPFTDADPAFDLVRGYGAALEVMRRRGARGERPVGHKLGFTNRTIWEEYNVFAPVWGPLYDTTVGAAADSFSLAGLIEPKIEPEIVFRFGRAPQAGMTAGEIFACVSHVALGFELVQSVFPGWRFRAPDTVAAFALHGALVHGPFAEIDEAARADWLGRLGSFRAVLRRNAENADVGESSNVLGGGPVAAIPHLVEVLKGLPGAPALRESDIFTTGTLTRALSVAPGETWEVSVDSLDLGPLKLTLT